MIEINCDKRDFLGQYLELLDLELSSLIFPLDMPYLVVNQGWPNICIGHQISQSSPLRTRNTISHKFAFLWDILSFNLLFDKRLISHIFLTNVMTLGDLDVNELSICTTATLSTVLICLRSYCCIMELQHSLRKVPKLSFL